MHKDTIFESVLIVYTTNMILDHVWPGVVLAENFRGPGTRNVFEYVPRNGEISCIFKDC